MTTYEILLIAGAVILALTLLFPRLERRYRKRKGRDPYLEALRHLVSGEEDTAYDCLVETVRSDISNIDAYIILGDILRRRGDVERALKVHRDVTIRSDLTRAVLNLMLKSLALDYAALQRWKSAERTLIELDRISRDDIWPRLQLLKVYEAQRNWSAAFQLGRQLAGEPEVSGSRLARYRIEQAGILVAQMSYHKARIILKEALKYDPACTEAYLAIGDTYDEEERTEDAVEWWEKMVDEVPERAIEAFPRLENSLYKLGAFSHMADIYTRHLSANPDSAEAALALSHLYERKGEVGEAIEVLQNHRPHVQDAHLLNQAIARLYYKSGEIDKALELVFGASIPHTVDEAEPAHSPAAPDAAVEDPLVEDEAVELEGDKEEFTL